LHPQEIKPNWVRIGEGGMGEQGFNPSPCLRSILRSEIEIKESSIGNVGMGGYVSNGTLSIYYILYLYTYIHIHTNV
jgi:hypothetical protein